MHTFFLEIYSKKIDINDMTNISPASANVKIRAIKICRICRFVHIIPIKSNLKQKKKKIMS